MGGYGSGRRGTCYKVEECLTLDATRWQRDGFFRGCESRIGAWEWRNSVTGKATCSIGYRVEPAGGAWQVHLNYTITQTREALDYHLRLAATRPQYGGRRWWFLCPLTVNGGSCGRRVRKLYIPPHCKYFGCRYCYNLTYQCGSEDAQTRALTKAQTIRAQLGGSSSLVGAFPEKPKGMWWRSYDRLRTRSEDAEMKSLAFLGDWMYRRFRQ